jgi:hypothetical protein
MTRMGRRWSARKTARASRTRRASSPTSLAANASWIMYAPSPLFFPSRPRILLEFRCLIGSFLASFAFFADRRDHSGERIYQGCNCRVVRGGKGKGRRRGRCQREPHPRLSRRSTSELGIRIPRGETIDGHGLDHILISDTRRFIRRTRTPLILLRRRSIYYSTSHAHSADAHIRCAITVSNDNAATVAPEKALQDDARTACEG